MKELRKIVHGANNVLFVTGAGLSAGSGLPTYRGIGGLYDNKVTDEGCSIEEVLSHTMFRKRPELTWKYLWEIGDVLKGAKPNLGHEIIAEIEREKPGSWVLTQNIDGLHHVAGTKNLIEVHGRAGDLICTGCEEIFDGHKILEQQPESRLAAEQGIPTIEINPEATALSDLVDYHIKLEAVDALKMLWDFKE